MKQRNVFLHTNTTCLLGLLFLASLFLGCGGSELDTTYGKRHGGPSVNGLDALARLFSAKGGHVESRSVISPGLKRCDTIVWAPNAIDTPNAETLAYFEDWLAEGYDRTLVFVGRDFDAAIPYWEAAIPKASAQDVGKFKARLQTAKSDLKTTQTSISDNEYARWFTVRKRTQPTKPKTFAGDWNDRFDGSKSDIRYYTTLEEPTKEESFESDLDINVAVACANYGENYPLDFEVLLKDGETPLVIRITSEDWGDGQILVVANGSFLFNMSLVNHEHRKLANEIVESRSSGERVAFLETFTGSPEILDKDPVKKSRTGLDALATWPINVPLIHLAILGMLYCAWQFPIFGRPKHGEQSITADFGKHIKSVGKLLARSKNDAHAQQQLTHYQQHVLDTSLHPATHTPTPPNNTKTEPQK